VLDPATTVYLFLQQVLNGNTALSQVVHWGPKEFTASAYCQARKQLPLEVFTRLLEKATFKLTESLPCPLWHGHRTFIADGSGFSMPDVPALARVFGYPGGQKPGCGFPVASLVVLFNAATGFLLELFALPRASHEMAYAADLHPKLKEGDILLGDRAFCSYAHLALLVQQKLHGLFRLHQRILVDFRPRRAFAHPKAKPAKGLPRSKWLRRLGITDQVVEWYKPLRRPVWMSQEEYDRLPDSLEVRELRYRIGQKGFRTQEVTLVTSLLDAAIYPASDLADLYRQRWKIETNLRHLKTTMKMDVLRSKSLEGIEKELMVYALAYNLVRAVMVEAADRMGVAIERVSFLDALRWLLAGADVERLGRLVVNPHRAGRFEPRAIKRRPKQYDLLVRPRSQAKQQLQRQNLAA
jgi:hypothetical protein